MREIDGFLIMKSCHLSTVKEPQLHNIYIYMLDTYSYIYIHTYIIYVHQIICFVCIYLYIYIYTYMYVCTFGIVWGWSEPTFFLSKALFEWCSSQISWHCSVFFSSTGWLAIMNHIDDKLHLLCFFSLFTSIILSLKLQREDFSAIVMVQSCAGKHLPQKIESPWTSPTKYYWLVVWNIFYFPFWGYNHPNWLIFFRGVETTNQYP